MISSGTVEHIVDSQSEDSKTIEYIRKTGANFALAKKLRKPYLLLHSNSQVEPFVMLLSNEAHCD